MEYLVQIEEFGRVVHNQRHRGSQPNVALRRALDQSRTSGPAEAYIANKHASIWKYTIGNQTAVPRYRKDSLEDPRVLMSGNVRLSRQ